MSRKRIFISSVQKEFANERKQLCDYIRYDALLGKFFEPFLFEELPAIDLTAQQAYLSEVSNCDIYLAILGQSYGFVSENEVRPPKKNLTKPQPSTSTEFASSKHCPTMLSEIIGKRHLSRKLSKLSFASLSKITKNCKVPFTLLWCGIWKKKNCCGSCLSTHRIIHTLRLTILIPKKSQHLFGKQELNAIPNSAKTYRPNNC